MLLQFQQTQQEEKEVEEEEDFKNIITNLLFLLVIFINKTKNYKAMTSNRVTYLRRKSYNTKSNKIRKIRTPGGRLTAQYIKKREKGV
jgi:hypothetical protein